MATLAAVLETREQNILAAAKDFYKELQKLSETPQETEEVEIKLYNLIRPNNDEDYSLVQKTDEIMLLFVNDAFVNSKFKRIRVIVVQHGSRHVWGRNLALINAIFDGLARNTFVETLSLEASEPDVWVTVPCLPPNLKELSLEDLDLREFTVGSRKFRKGLPELILQLKHLKTLKLYHCILDPKELGMALSVNKSIGHLVLAACNGDMDEFFDSVNSSTLKTLELSGYYKYWSIDYDFESMHGAFKQKRLAPEKLGLVSCLEGKNMHQVAKMLADCTSIKELDLSSNYLRDDGVQSIIWSVQNKIGLRSIDLSMTDSTLKSAEIIKDFVRSRPDGTLDSVRFSSNLCMHPEWSSDQQEEIDSLLDINKLKPLIRESQGVPLSVLQHKRLACTYFYIRSKPDVCWNGTDAKEPPRKRQKVHHDSSGGSWCTIY